MAAVEIAIPPRSVYVGVVRLAIASLARQAGFDEDRVDDLRIAVSEACTSAVLAHEDAGSAEVVLVRWTDEADRLVIDVESSVEARAPRADDTDSFSSRGVLSHALLESLVDETELSGTRAHLVVRKI